jgi:hypothetical protein
MRLALALFAGFTVANAFFWWSFPAWFSLFGSPDGLITPFVDKWVITPVAMGVYVIQFPSYVVVSQTAWWDRGTSPPLVILASLLSSALYTPLALWATRFLRRRRTTSIWTPPVKR